MLGVFNATVHDERQAKLAARLRVARQQMNLSQADLAKLLNKRQQFVSKYESGERKLDFFEVLDLLDLLGISLSDLLLRLAQD